MNERLLEYVENQHQESLADEIARVRAAAHVEKPTDFSGECVECEDEIPQARLATGAITCISCQTEKEHRDKLKANNRYIDDTPSL